MFSGSPPKKTLDTIPFPRYHIQTANRAQGHFTYTAESLPVCSSLCPVFYFFAEMEELNKSGKFRSHDALPLTLTVPEVGEVLGLSRAKAYDLARSEGFPSMRIGRRILVPRNKLIRWIDEQTEARE